MREELPPPLKLPTLELMPRTHGENPPINIHSLYLKKILENGIVTGLRKVKHQLMPTKEELPPTLLLSTNLLKRPTPGDCQPNHIHSLLLYLNKMTRNGIATGFQKVKHQLMLTREELLPTSPPPTKLLMKPMPGENPPINIHSL